MLLYSLLHLSGFDLGLDDLKQFRQLHSRTPGHPEHGLTQGVETTTGPLGQGFANGIGMALGAKMAAARFANPALEARVFGIVSDGDLMEGISTEAGSLAGHLGLGNVVYLYDDNRITIDGSTDLTFSEDVPAKFAALGWHTQRIDGHDHEAIANALAAAIRETERPSLIACRTHIAKGSPTKQDTAASHGAPLGQEEVLATKRALGIPLDEFFVGDDVRALFADALARKEAERREWLAGFAAWRSKAPAAARAYDAFAERRTPPGLFEQLLAAAGEAQAATRALSGKVIQRAAELVPSLVSGSADLNASCKTDIKASTSVRKDDLSGRNLHYGIREHAMASMMNGLSLFGGYLPIGSTFLVFSDYMRPAIRLAALTGLPVVFVFTHDSLMVGEDGPTHEPVEQCASLRLIPNLHVVRPADGQEVAAAWTHALSRRKGPVALLLTRQEVPKLARPNGFDRADLLRGAHVVNAPDGARATLIATGAEVGLAVAAADRLAARGIALRVVSMPCVELFLDQERGYREQVLPPSEPVFALEMGSPEIWCQFTGSLDRVIGVQRFGLSAPYHAIAQEFGFTPDAVAEQLAPMLG
jgi:transketolase